MGYKVKHKILFAGHYGIPQMRFRTVFIGIKDYTGEITFPEPVYDAKAVANFTGAQELCIPTPPLFYQHLQPQTTVWNALSDLPFIAKGGGNKSELAKWVDSFLGEKGWIEKQFSTAVIVDESKLESPTHKVDCYKNRIALVLEWNNKDPFFDRDLNNFRLLFDLRAISVGIIFTRCDELQEIFNSLGRGSSYGNSTTHMSKLLPRIEGGSGAGCPLIVIGITKKLYIENI